MAGADVARILDAEAPLYRGFEEIAKLGNHRQQRPQPQERSYFSCARRCKYRRHHEAAKKAANSARPGLFRADPGPEFWAADAAAGKVAADIGRPDQQQHEEQRGESVDGILPDKDG